MARVKQTARAAAAKTESEPEVIETGTIVETGLLEEEFHCEGVEGAFAALFVAKELGATYEFCLEQKFPSFEQTNRTGYYYGKFVYKDGTLLLKDSRTMVPSGDAYVGRSPLSFGQSGLSPVRGLSVKEKSIWAEVFFKITCELLRKGIDTSNIAPLREKFIDWAIKIGADAARVICATLKALIAEPASSLPTDNEECDQSCAGPCVGKHDPKEDPFLKTGRRVIEVLFAPIVSALKMLELDPSLYFVKELRPRKRSFDEESDREAKRAREESSDEEESFDDSTDEWQEPFSMPKFMEKLLRHLGSEYPTFLDACEPGDTSAPYEYLISGIIEALGSYGRVNSECAIPDDLSTELARNQWAANAMAEAAGTEDLLELYENAIRE